LRRGFLIHVHIFSNSLDAVDVVVKMFEVVDYVVGDLSEKSGLFEVQGSIEK